METLYFENRNKWREWLKQNYKTKSEVWFVFAPKNSFNGVIYNDAVEEALCFNWIDGRAGKLSNGSEVRRFTPRKTNSFSRINIERLIWLNDNGLLEEEVKKSVKDILETPFVFPEDIIEEIKKDEVAYKNYLNFSLPYQRIRIAYIDSARKDKSEFDKRLKTFIIKTRQNKLIVGYGGIEKYYK